MSMAQLCVSSYGHRFFIVAWITKQSFSPSNPYLGFLHFPISRHVWSAPLRNQPFLNASRTLASHSFGWNFCTGSSSPCGCHRGQQMVCMCWFFSNILINSAYDHSFSWRPPSKWWCWRSESVVRGEGGREVSDRTSIRQIVPVPTYVQCYPSRIILLIWYMYDKKIYCILSLCSDRAIKTSYFLFPVYVVCS